MEKNQSASYSADDSGLACLRAGDAAVEGGEAGFSDSPGMFARALQIVNFNYTFGMEGKEEGEGLLTQMHLRRLE